MKRMRVIRRPRIEKALGFRPSLKTGDARGSGSLDGPSFFAEKALRLVYDKVCNSPVLQKIFVVARDYRTGGGQPGGGTWAHEIPKLVWNH